MASIDPKTVEQIQTLILDFDMTLADTLPFFLKVMAENLAKESEIEPLISHGRSILASSLTESEFNLIKLHPETGFEILKTIEFPWPVAEIVLQHHERYDGSAYPQGLKGEEINIAARILSVADVIEAMSSHRPYRPSLGIDSALEEIEKNKGTYYDPEVVEACLLLFKEKDFCFPEADGYVRD